VQALVTFEEFAATRLAGLLRFATVLTHERGLAEDVCQEVLFRAHKRWDSIGAMAAPDAYVRRMIVNEYLSWRRKWSRVLPRPDEDLDRAEPDHADRHAIHAELIAAVGKLPPKQRAAIVLRYFEGLTDAEIADLLGCRPVTARGYIWRALRTLRVDFDESAPDEPLDDEPAPAGAALCRKES
jgi:RNA polymerase sigma-70 factor (sigma-E family)